MHWCVFFEAEVGACRLFFLSAVPLLALYRWRWGKLPWSKHRWSVFVADGSVCVFLSMTIRAAGDSLILIRLFLGPSADLQTVADIHKWIFVRAHSTVNNLCLSVCMSVCLSPNLFMTPPIVTYPLAALNSELFSLNDVSRDGPDRYIEKYRETARYIWIYHFWPVLHIEVYLP